MAGDQRARRRHAHEDRAGPLADSRAGLLAERGVGLVADDHGVDGGDLAGVADEPLVGLDGDRAVGTQVVLRAEQRRRDAVAVAPGGQLVVELVDEVAAVREDQHPAGARRLDEAHGRDRLAGTRGVLEPEALAGVGILGRPLVEVLVDVGVGIVVLVGVRLVLGLVLLLGESDGLVVLLLVLLILLGRRRDDDVVVVLVVVVLLVVLVLLLELRLLLGHDARRGPLGVGDRGVGGRLVDRQHGRRGGGRGGRAAALLAGQQRGQRPRERVDLVRVERRAVGEHDLLLGEHALEAEQQRVPPPPLRGGDLEAVLELLERAVQRPAAGAAGGERLGGLLPGMQEGLARVALGLSDLLRSGKGGGRRHARGLGHEARAGHALNGNVLRISQDPGTTPGLLEGGRPSDVLPRGCREDTAPADGPRRTS